MNPSFTCRTGRATGPSLRFAKSIGFFSLSSVLFFLSGCEHVPLPTARSGEPAAPSFAPASVQPAPVATLDPAFLQPGDSTFRLGPGDKLEIEVMGDVGTRATVTIGPDGKLYYYLLPGLDVWGLTLAETRGRLAAELQKYIREQPVVSLALKEVASQRIWVLGRVNSPGVYTLAGPTTLLDAIAQAGGLTSGSPYASLAASLGVSAPNQDISEAADLSRSFIIRQGKLLPVDFHRLLREGDLSQNIYLQPDDFVFLPSTRSSRVHVLGAVVQPNSPRLNGGLTVVQAIALSGGTVREAYLPNVAVLRGSLANPQIAIVSVDQVLKGATPDVRLEPGDIVYVPFRPERVLRRYVDLILDTFARTVGVNAGARAVSGTSAPVAIGVSISP